MTSLEILRGARELLSDPERWRRGSYASLNGFEVDPLDPRAEKFCAVGAMWRVAKDDQRAFLLASKIHPELVLLNDGEDGYHQVLRVFDEEIARREEMTEGAPLPEVPVETSEPALA